MLLTVFVPDSQTPVSFAYVAFLVRDQGACRHRRMISVNAPWDLAHPSALRIAESGDYLYMSGTFCLPVQVGYFSRITQYCGRDDWARFQQG